MKFFYGLTAAALLLAPGVIRAGTDVPSVDVNPHYSDILCTACHIDEEDYELRSEDQVGFCNRCHGDGRHIGAHHPLRAVPESIEVPEDWPLLDNRLTCMTCHLPGHEEYRGIDRFLRDGPYVSIPVFCESCHRPDFRKMRNPHAEVNRGEGCGFCHDTEPTPGVDTLQTVDFCADPVILCLRCHDSVGHPAGFVHLGRVDPSVRQQLRSGVKLFRGDTLVCSTCHNPHVLESQNHKLRGVVSSTQACPGCHDQ